MSATDEHDGGSLPLTLIVFAYNEATNVPLVLPGIVEWLRGRGAPWQLVFVDDGSTDGTADAVRALVGSDPNVKLVQHDRNRGIGAALKSGARAATQPWMTFLPCDGQIPIEGLDRLCDEAVRADVGVVFSTYRQRDDGWHRKLLSGGVRGLILAVHGVVMRSDGPYLCLRSLFDPDVLTPDTFFLNFEFPIRILRQGAPHSTVEIECVPRLTGHSKSTGFNRIVGVGRDLLELRVRLGRGG